jgi:hypothetical protein
MIIPRRFLLIMRNVSDVICREKSHHAFYVLLTFFSENRAVYEVMWKNTVETDEPQMAI